MSQAYAQAQAQAQEQAQPQAMLRAILIGVVAGTAIGATVGGILYALEISPIIAICLGVLSGIIILGTQVAFTHGKAAPAAATEASDHTVLVVKSTAPPIVIYDEDPK
jgi:ribose/xylose/arabinose/galactoside ABC-type transport system permease subunit